MHEETIIKKIHPHPASFLGFYFLGIISIFVGLVASPYFILGGVFVFVLSEIVRRAETFYVLKSGVERKYHLLSTSKKFVEYEKIQNIEVHQSILHRMLGIGSVHMDSAGGDTIEVNFHGVKDPYGIEKLIRAEMVSK
jgi:putative membrane protein